MTRTTAHIALGSNLGDREATIRRAVATLDEHDGVDVLRLSSIRETEPVGSRDQGPYLNAVVEVRTSLSARALLEMCLTIEAAHGRDRRRIERWGPRTIDLDLLLYGDAVIDEPGLHVPHPRLQERLFVLEPLAELIPTQTHPLLDRTIQSLLTERRSGERSAGIR